MKKNVLRRQETRTNALLRRQKRDLAALRKNAEIEAGLERVRSRAMAMQNPAELSALVATVISELTQLDVALSWCLITLLDEETWSCRVWRANAPNDPSPQCFMLPFADYPFQLAIMLAWKERRQKWRYELKGAEKNAIDDYMFTRTDYRNLPKPVQDGIRSLDTVWFSFSFGAFGGLQVGGQAPLSDANMDILARFGKVFDLTYTRFNDLQNAEAQARESRIEAALERVRGKAMAMRGTGDVNETVKLVFVELKRIGTELKRIGFGLMDRVTRDCALHSAANRNDQTELILLGTTKLDTHPVMVNIFDKWIENEEYFPVLEGQNLHAYNQRLRDTGFPVPPQDDDGPLYGYFFPFVEGELYCWADKALSDSDVSTLRRFSAVIGLTYRRYTELQQAEANNRDATRQASLDRVRAEIASMRTAADLDRITPLVWNELTSLGVPFICCGIFLMDEAQRVIRVYLSTPDGKAIAAFPMTYETEGIGSQVLQHWHNNSIFTGHWDQQEFKLFYAAIALQGALDLQEGYQTGFPSDGLYLHFIPFLQGMLYVGSIAPLTDAEINLIQSLTGAFATAYARYDDFVRLEAAKLEVDRTLVELKAAQSQLVQSEKMASLGELTAGIAHEIQNPLNFVNNFSEVNIELIDEMKVELAEGNYPAVIALSDDIRQNLEKINIHGKRADSIVKNMLQHSRKSTGQKEAADINALSDEYLRLCYHGLRAKEKWFNVKFETQFSEELPKARIVTQDIGRVLLNLLTNAFYSLMQKAKREGDGFQPIIRLATAKWKDMIEIRIRDNGVGIPAAVLDKIYHPFFTTKPAGDGTGLGLSLSYDIITKEHNGTIEVETAAGEYAEFILRLPV